MLLIRKEQMKVFEQKALQNFEDEMVEHLEIFSPPLFKAVGEEQMRKVISFGIAQANSYGFTFRGPVRLYLEMMLVFGSYFDTDPQYPWATEILANQGAGPQMDRAEMLFEKMMDYRKKVAGPKDAYMLKALRNTSDLAMQPLSLSTENFISTMRQEIARVYPQKAAYVGDERLEALIREGIEKAQSQRFSTVRGTTLLIVLMLAFGHGCEDDLLYPWIARTLNDKPIPDPESKSKRLERKSLTWLEHAMVHLDRGAQT